MNYKIQVFKSVDTTEIMRSIIWILLVLRALSGFLFEIMTSNILYNPKKVIHVNYVLYCVSCLF